MALPYSLAWQVLRARMLPPRHPLCLPHCKAESSRACIMRSWRHFAMAKRGSSTLCCYFFFIANAGISICQKPLHNVQPSLKHTACYTATVSSGSFPPKLHRNYRAAKRQALST
jgi:hypothetical protein